MDHSTMVDRAIQRALPLFRNAFVLPALTDTPYLEGLRRVLADDPDLADRAAQAAQFQHDWRRLSPATANYAPHLGDSDEKLGWGSEASQVALYLFCPEILNSIGEQWVLTGAPSLPIQDRLGLLGGALDAYFGCVDDNRRQLKIAYEAWRALESSAPSMEMQRREYFVGMCRADLQNSSN
jgi:hypothetical protein